MAFLVLLAASARAGIVATYVLLGVHRLIVASAAQSSQTPKQEPRA
jgi:hypothetical protein